MNPITIKQARRVAHLEHRRGKMPRDMLQRFPDEFVLLVSKDRHYLLNLWSDTSDADMRQYVQDALAYKWRKVENGK